MNTANTARSLASNVGERQAGGKVVALQTFTPWRDSLQELRLDPYERAVLQTILHHGRSVGRCRLRVETIAEEACVSARKTGAVIKQLQSKVGLGVKRTGRSTIFTLPEQVLLRPRSAPRADQSGTTCRSTERNFSERKKEKDTAPAKPKPKIHNLEFPKPQPTKHTSPWTESTERTPDGDVVPNLPPAKWKLLVEIADETGPDHYRLYRNGYIRAAAELDEETLKSLLTQITGGISEGNLDNPGAFFLMRAKKIREQAKS